MKTTKQEWKWARITVAATAMGLVAGCASLPEYEPVSEPATVVAVPAEEPAPAPVTEVSADCVASLEAAQQRVEDARAIDLDVSEAERFLAAAETARADSDNAATCRNADKAYKHANTSINAFYMDKAAEALEETKHYANLSLDQFNRAKDGETAYNSGNGEEAFEILDALNAELAVAESLYTVASGDSLWKISARDEFYGNPYWWPLIYKTNADQIRDPDQLFLGQELTIRMHPTITEVETAVEHAYTRGSWTVGEREEADQRYLNR